jgi:CYTH domain-containing protein
VLSGASDWAREPGRGKYARVERERRFRVTGPVPASSFERLIEDRYLDGTSLRLRRVSHDGSAVHKLTQKVRPVESDPSEVRITNTYLSEGEYALLSALPGAVLTKVRTVVPTPTHELVVDTFCGRLQGLRLAEVEVRERAEITDLPQWLGAEVTHDDRFSGAQLARADGNALRKLLQGG